MDLQQVDILEAKGAEAFANNQVEDAISFFSESASMAESIFKSKLAVILSKRAEAYLSQKAYESAWSDANDSLLHDPSLVKSMFIRATCAVELDTPQEAIHDLKMVLSAEPLNSEARALLRTIVPLARMDAIFSSTYIAHYFFRLLKKSAPQTKKKNSIKIPLLRMLFLSNKVSSALRRYITGCVISEVQSGGGVCLGLPNWFSIALTNVSDTFHSSVAVVVSRKCAVQLLQILKPPATLSFLSEAFVNEMTSVYRFHNVVYRDERKLMSDDQSFSSAEVVKKAAKYLTRLPYCLEILNFDNPEFPSLLTVVFASDFSINFNFLRIWYEWIWPIKHVVFTEYVPDLSVFKRFRNGILCTTVRKIHIPLANNDCEIGRIGDEFGRIGADLHLLKQRFGYLREVVGTMKFTLPRKSFSDLTSGLLKKYIKVLALKADKIARPSWLPRLSILVEFTGALDSGLSCSEMLILLGQMVNECRSEPGLESICCHGPCPVTFDWLENSVSLAQITISNETADFQLIFR